MGTCLFYLLCSLPKPQQNKKTITFLVLTGGLLLFIPLSRMLQSWQGITTLGSLLILGFYPLYIRKLPYMKSILISACWTFFILILPLWLCPYPNNLPYAELILGSILFYALTIPSDIRDSKNDPDSMRTLPQMIGDFRSGIVGILLIVLFGLGYYLILGKAIMLAFILFELSVFSYCLRQQTDLTVHFTDATLMALGILYFYLWSGE